MIARRFANAQRRGITLTEILIAIMILGVGLVSLATLFPIGLLRLRDATRYSRTKYLVDSAAADGTARALFNRAVVRARGRRINCSMHQLQYRLLVRHVGASDTSTPSRTGTR